MTKRKKQETCFCSAYDFPHRMYGGKCEGFDLEDDEYLSEGEMYSSVRNRENCAYVKSEQLDRFRDAPYRA